MTRALLTACLAAADFGDSNDDITVVTVRRNP